MTDLDKLAKSLTKAQRVLLMNHPFWAASTYGTISACRRKGLLDGPTLTPLGLALRNHLEKSDG